MSLGLYGLYVVEMAMITAGMVLLFGSGFSDWPAVVGIVCWVFAVVWPASYIYKLFGWNRRMERRIRLNIMDDPDELPSSKAVEETEKR